MSGPTPNLPPELILTILDHLRNDRPALSKCSLVCKAWISPCRIYLMENHSISTSKARTPLNPAIKGQYTRNLIVSGTNHTPASSWPEETQFFTRITSFYLVFSPVDHPLQTRISSTFTLVSHLELHQIRFASLSDLVRLVCSFPVLESLSVAKSKWPDRPSELLPTLQPSRRWRFLSIQSTWLDPLLDWFKSLKPVPRLSTFCVDMLAFPGSIARVGSTIISLGEYLEHLMLVVLNGGNQAAEWIDLKHNPNLRKLDVFFSTSISLLVDMLESHKPNVGIEEITFSLSSLREDVSVWRDLDRTLVDMHARTRIKRLIYRGEAVRSWPEHPLDMEVFGRDLMPESTALGIVQVVRRQALQDDEKNLNLNGFPSLARLRKTDLLYVLQ